MIGGMDNIKRIHFVGIGGIGMSGIAWLCLRKGYSISGSDIKAAFLTNKLADEGAKIFIGHRSENIEDPDIVVYSSAVLEQNPELQEARAKGIPLLKRGEFLSFMGEAGQCIAVTGAHGKTTTSSLVATMLQEAGLSPSGVVGALVPYFDGNAFIGEGKHFVVEADESDGSFLFLKPDIAVITNIDLEHLDYYNSMEQIKEAYLKFMEKVPANGKVICWGEDENICSLLENFKGSVMTYGLNNGNDLRAKNIEFNGMASEFDCYYKTKYLGRFVINIPGEHNVLNSLAAIAVGLSVGLNPEVIISAVSEYRGAERRFQIKTEEDGIVVVDDYAHHPTEIIATLKVARSMNPKRLVTIFQPHRFSRTKFLKDRFAKAFDGTDYLILTDIYPADERPIYGVTSMLIYNDIVKTKKINVNYLAKGLLLDYVSSFVRKGDMLLFLGAGDIGKLSGEFVKMINDREKMKLVLG
ncbi:MAG: UDP-N-acetylmuramate--L-alanine ligase [Candidatus Omnitrophota bacterium]